MINSAVIGKIVDLKKYWKYILVIALVLGAFGTGRYLVPNNVRTITIEHTSSGQVQQIGNSTENQNKEVKIQYVDRPVDHIITKTVIKEVGGKVTETTTDSTHVGNTVVNTVQDTQVKVQTQVKTEIVYKDKIIEKEKIVDNTKRSRWDIGVGVGYGLTDTTTIIPGLSKNLVVTADVSYKILGPFSVGVWGSTRKDIGAMVRIGF